MELKKPRMYFGKNVDDAIVQYNETEDPIQKEKLFISLIYPAFATLAENVLFKYMNGMYGGYKFGDLKNDLVAHLFQQLGKFKPSKNKRAFSYYNRVSINFCNGRKNEFSKLSLIGEMVDVDMRRNISGEISTLETQDEISDFCDKWSQWGIENVESLFEKKKEQQVANAIFDLFRNCNGIDNFNRKALYIMIREQVEVKTQIITDTIKMLKPLYKEMYIEFRLNGTDNWDEMFLPQPETIEDEISEMFEEVDNYM